MANNETAHELILQILKTRMTFRQTIQRVLRTNNVDMTFEMLQVMHRLWKKPGVSQQYLAEQTAKDKACLTNLINNLEKKGWVERRGNPTDRRNKQIYLTEEGARLALRVKPLLHGIYGLIGDEMPSRQIVSCRNNLQKINGGVSKLAHLFLCTRPRLSQAGALLLPKNYVSLGIYFYYVKDTFSSLQSQPNSAFSSKN